MGLIKLSVLVIGPIHVSWISYKFPIIWLVWVRFPLCAISTAAAFSNQVWFYCITIQLW